MTLTCIAYNCRSRKREKDVGFHRFPHHNPKLLKLWIAKLKWKNWTPSANTLICSKHFEDKYVNRLGLRPRLFPGAVPTIFDFPDSVGPRKALIDPRSRRATCDTYLLKELQVFRKRPRGKFIYQSPGGVSQNAAPFQSQRQAQSVPLTPEVLQPQTAPQPKQGPQAQTGFEPKQAPGAQAISQHPQEPQPQGGCQQQQGPQLQTGLQNHSESQKLPPPQTSKKKRKLKAGQQEQPRALVSQDNTLIPWPIQGDTNLLRRRIPASLFHSHYCLPQSFYWPGDAEANFEPLLTENSVASTIPHVIKINTKWQWLGLDFRGPLPQTINGDHFIMTVTDYHSKWVEAFPVATMVSKEAAGILCDLCAQFGYPLGVLTRLHRTATNKLNGMIRHRLQEDGLEYGGTFIVHHRQAAYLDFVTESLINRMVSELVKEHPNTWNVYLPGFIVRFCCREHPTIEKSPFARMYIKETKSVTTPRDLPFSPAIVEDSSFVIDLSENPDISQEQTTRSQLTDTLQYEQRDEGLTNEDGQIVLT